MRRRILSILLFCLLLFVVANAWYLWTNYRETLPGDAKSPSAPFSLKVLASQSWIDRPFLDRAFKAYQVETGIPIDIQVVPGQSADSIIAKKFAVNVLADIVLFYGGAQTAELRPDQNLAAFDGEPWASNLEPFAIPHVTYNFKIYGFPLWDGGISGIVYNRTLFERYGLKVPTSEAEFFQVCESLKSRGIIPFYLGFRDVRPIDPQFGIDILASKVPDLVTKLNRNQAKLSEYEEMRNAAAWYEKLAENGYLGPRFVTNNSDGQTPALASGRYAMAFGTDTYIHADLTSDKAGSFRYGLMPLYMGNGDQGKYVRAETISMYVNQNGEHADEALAFIRWLSRPDKLNEWFRGLRTETTFRSVSSNVPTPEYMSAFERGEADRIIPSSANLIVGYSPYEFAAPLQEMMLGEITPRQAVERMDEIRIANAGNRHTPGF